MNYYYDTLSCSGEVERHIKRTRLTGAFSKPSWPKQAAKAGEDASKGVNYGRGVRFGAASWLSSTLVEVGSGVQRRCGDCGAADIEGFMIRSTPAQLDPSQGWPQAEGDKLVPIEKTPLFDGRHEWEPDSVAWSSTSTLQQIRSFLQRLLTKGLGRHRQGRCPA